MSHDDVAIHGDGHEGEDRRKDGCGLHDADEMAQVGSKHPAALVEGVGGRQGDAEDAHDQVDKCQVADEEVGGVVPLLLVPDEEQQEDVPGAGDQNHGGVERDEEEPQVKQEIQAGEGGGRKRGGWDEGPRGIAAQGGE